MDARYFYIRDPTKAKQLSILHITDIDNLADIFIKVLPFDTFIKIKPRLTLDMPVCRQTDVL